MKKILIVEDDQKIAMALVIRLKANGYNASIAPDAIAGASQARALKPDLILLDISLPGGDGFQLAETFLRMPETNGTPVIFITASKNPELMQKVMELGAIGLFEKPFDTEKLLGSIDDKFNRMADLVNVRQSSGAHKPLER
ncbi:MAG: response regulator [Verrucomicrobiota bacterium]|jgi:DNA-binding response OmpR family regulator